MLPYQHISRPNFYIDLPGPLACDSRVSGHMPKLWGPESLLILQIIFVKYMMWAQGPKVTINTKPQRSLIQSLSDPVAYDGDTIFKKSTAPLNLDHWIKN